MNKVRTIMIDGIAIRTSLSAVEIANLPKVNAELKKENEKLNHYKLLYQKVKERNDKAIEFINNNGEKQYNHHDNYRGKWYTPDELDTLDDILKGNNEVSNEDN